MISRARERGGRPGWTESPKRVEPPILVMSLTESPDEVERLAHAVAGICWNSASENAVVAKPSSSSAVRATGATAIAGRSAGPERDVRVYAKRARNIDAPWKAVPTIVTTRGRGVRAWGIKVP